ncbi:lipopolysaccharide biosynthesis protein [Psychrosphaera algicola]|uniref:MATE family efflux transporter n=1 Tax=Psychrosphaera algicola TaxID=3023714 RepID=A0ABT5FJG8_9GAMM|nr:MATE family efflux transporter [Psychrosphaera sp. G1-22]MDC2891345.1 MATE family efflux transporter [Psychrosphaera sp. G1-22]
MLGKSKLFKKSVENDFFQVLSQSLYTMIIRVFGAFSGFLLNVCVARTLAPDNAGELFTLLSLALFFGQLATLGLGNWLLKVLSLEKANENAIGLNSTFFQTVYVVLILGTLFSLVIYLSSFQIALLLFDESFEHQSIRILSLAFPFVGLLAILMSAFQAVSKPVLGLAVHSVIQPLLFGLSCLLFVDDLQEAIYSYLLSLFITLPIGFFFWKTIVFTKLVMPKPKWILSNEVDFYGFFFIMIIGIILTQGPILLSAALFSSKDVAFISIAIRIAGLTSFVLVACNMVLSPHFSRLKGSGDIKKIEEFALKGTYLMFALASPLFIVLIVFPEFLLGFLVQTTLLPLPFTNINCWTVC